MADGVRLLVYGLNHSPEPTGVGRYTGDMVAWLAAHGHEVRVVTAYPYYPAWRVAVGYRPYRYGHEVIDQVPVHRCPLWVPKAPRTATRMLHLALFALTSFPVLLWQAWRMRPDVVWTAEPTSFGLPGALLAARLGRAKSWLHVQDIELGAAVRLGMIRNRWLQRLVLRSYRFLLRRFDVVSTISPAMAEELHELGAPATLSFPNWVDVEAIRPGVATDRLRAELGLPPTGLIALYSGNMGEKQGVDTLVAAAKALADRPNVHFLLCGEGSGRARLEAEAAGLANVSLRPLQPLERFNELLNLADVHLLPQRTGTTLFAMPSKLGGMLASGRAIVAQADPGSAFAAFVEPCALVVPSEDAAATAAAIRRLAEDAGLRAELGAAGRKLALERLSREAILAAFVRDLERLVDTTTDIDEAYDGAPSRRDRSAQRS